AGGGIRAWDSGRRYTGARRATRRLDVDAFQSIRGQSELRIYLQHDVILVQLRKHSGNLALAERVVERVVDGLRQNAQARGGVAIDDQVGLHSVVLLVAVHVAQLRQGLQLLQKLLRPIG